MKLDGKQTSAFFYQYWGYIWSQLGFPWPRDRHPGSVYNRLITPYKFSVNLSQLEIKFNKSKKKVQKSSSEKWLFYKVVLKTIFIWSVWYRLMYPFEEWFYFVYLYFFFDSERMFHLNSKATVSNQKAKIFMENSNSSWIGAWRIRCKNSSTHVLNLIGFLAGHI